MANLAVTPTSKSVFFSVFRLLFSQVLPTLEGGTQTLDCLRGCASTTPRSQLVQKMYCCDTTYEAIQRLRPSNENNHETTTLLNDSPVGGNFDHVGRERGSSGCVLF